MSVALPIALAALAFLYYIFALVMAVGWTAAQFMDLHFAKIRPPLFGRTGLWLTSAFFVRGMVGQPLILVFFHAQQLAPDLVSRAPRILLDAGLLAFAIYRGAIAIFYAKLYSTGRQPGYALRNMVSWAVIMAVVAWCDTKLADEPLIVAIALIVTTARALTMRVYFRWWDFTKPVLEDALRFQTEGMGPTESRVGEWLAGRPDARTLARTLFWGGLILAVAALAADQVTETLSGTVPILIAMILSMFFDRTAERIKAVREEFPEDMARADRAAIPLPPERLEGARELEAVLKQVRRHLATKRPSYVVSVPSTFNATRLLAFTVYPGVDGAQDEIYLDALNALTRYYWHRAHALQLLPGPVPHYLRDSGDLRMLAVLSSVLTHESGARSIPSTNELERAIGKTLPLDAAKARSMLLAMSQEARGALGWSWRPR